MKKQLYSTSIVLMLGLGLVASVSAQMMTDSGTALPDDHTAKEEAAGKAIWEKFQAKETACDKLADDDFDSLGEYFMGQMLGSSHAAMNAMMIRMLGEDGETEMHVVMGKRLSGCDTSAAFPSQGMGFMPMMHMLGGGWSSPLNRNQTNNPMMWNFGDNPLGWGFGFFGWIFMLLWWALIVAGVVALVKWVSGQSRGGSCGHGKSFDVGEGKAPLEILKERYAKGEMDKKEFEEKKKDLA